MPTHSRLLTSELKFENYAPASDFGFTGIYKDVKLPLSRKINSEKILGDLVKDICSSAHSSKINKASQDVAHGCIDLAAI